MWIIHIFDMDCLKKTMERCGSMKKWTKSCLYASVMMMAITLAVWCNFASLTIPSSSAGTENMSSLHSAIPKPSASITITTPSSSSSWNAGSSYYIYWTSSGTSGYVTIEYYYGGSYYTIASDVSNNEYYYWTVPSYLSSGYYQIYIYDASNSAIYSFSSSFYITSTGTISITSPTSSSSWNAGSSHYIYWTSSGTSGYVYIEYYYGGSSHVIASDIYDDGYYDWAIPVSISSGYYQIYIYDAANSNINSLSNSFYITNPYRYVTGFDMGFTVLGFLVGAIGVIALALKKHHLQM